MSLFDELKRIARPTEDDYDDEYDADAEDFEDGEDF